MRSPGAAAIAKELGWKMPKELKAEWVAALEGGHYPQTRGLMNRTKASELDGPVGFCCLGVLCDVIDSTAWRPVTGYSMAWGNPLRHETFAPPPEIMPMEVARELWRYNDSLNWDFKRIAKYTLSIKAKGGIK